MSSTVVITVEMSRFISALPKSRSAIMAIKIGNYATTQILVLFHLISTSGASSSSKKSLVNADWTAQPANFHKTIKGLDRSGFLVVHCN